MSDVCLLHLTDECEVLYDFMTRLKASSRSQAVMSVIGDIGC